MGMIHLFGIVQVMVHYSKVSSSVRYDGSSSDCSPALDPIVHCWVCISGTNRSGVDLGTYGQWDNRVRDVLL